MNFLKLKNNTVYYGPAPIERDLKSIKGLYAVWNLLEGFPYQLEMEQQAVPLVISSPIPDYSVPQDLDKFNEDLKAICDLIDNGKTIYIHCYAGHGRTGTALALLTMKYMGLSADAAIDLSMKLCEGPEVKAQINFVKGMESNMRGSDIS